MNWLDLMRECALCRESKGAHKGQGSPFCPVNDTSGYRIGWHPSTQFEQAHSEKGHPIYQFEEYEVRVAIPDPVEELPWDEIAQDAVYE